MGGYLVEAIRIGTITIMTSYGVKCLGKIDQSRLIKMIGMSASGICVCKGVKFAYENPPQWILDAKAVGGRFAEVTNQLSHFDIKGLFGL